MRGRHKAVKVGALALICSMSVVTTMYGHGDVTPQPVNTEALPDIGEEWLEENPYRNAEKDVWLTAVEIGASAYNQNCARCHGLGGVSGGLAPDVRYLEADIDGDEWYVERYRYGYTQNGVTKMPAFGELLDQKAGWAIRTYIESRPDEDAIEAVTGRLIEIRDQLIGLTEAEGADESVIAGIRTELEGIAANIETASGSPLAESVASKSARQLDGSRDSLKLAAETLTVGLSAAK